MSEKTGTPKPSRSGAGVILSGLAVGVVLGAPVAAEPSAGTEPSAAASVCSQPDVASESAATAIREQFQTSFTAGAVEPPTVDLPTIICES
ncbi:hypothetical protein WEI85_21290 [Actinomycetes bacterium KLBMP 9797]